MMWSRVESASVCGIDICIIMYMYIHACNFVKTKFHDSKKAATAESKEILFIDVFGARRRDLNPTTITRPADFNYLFLLLERPGTALHTGTHKSFI